MADTYKDLFSFVSEVIKKYSNFVGVPIYLNGKRTNIIQVGLVHFMQFYPPSVCPCHSYLLIIFGGLISVELCAKWMLSLASSLYSKTFVKRPLSKRPKIVFQDQLSLNAGQK